MPKATFGGQVWEPALSGDSTGLEGRHYKNANFHTQIENQEEFLLMQADGTQRTISGDNAPKNTCVSSTWPTINSGHVSVQKLTQHQLQNKKNLLTERIYQ